MAIKGLKKSVIMTPEKEIEQFITKGGSLATSVIKYESHKLTLRLPQELMNKIDELRNERISKVSRNQCILDILEDYLG